MIKAKEGFLYGVCYVDPPAICADHNSSHPHGWSSRAIDTILDVKAKPFNILKSGWDEMGGLAIMFEVEKIKLKHYSTFCPHIEYVPKTNEFGLEIQDQCEVTSLEPLMGNTSCNPRGCFYFPYMPSLNEEIIANRRDAMCEKQSILMFSTRPRFDTAKAVTMFGCRKTFQHNRIKIKEKEQTSSDPGVMWSLTIPRGNSRRFTIGTSSHNNWIGSRGDLWREI